MNPVRDFISAALGVVNHVRQSSTDLAKIEASICYLKMVQAARRLVIGIVAFCFFLFMVAAALTMIHVVLLVYVPMGENARLVTALVLCGFDVLLVTAVLIVLLSEKAWMKLTRADRLTEDVMHDTGTQHAP